MMSLEQRYLAALQGAESWGFGMGRLVLTYRQGETWGALYFERYAGATAQ